MSMRNRRNRVVPESRRSALNDWETVEIDDDLKSLLIRWYRWGCRIPAIGAIGLMPDARFVRSRGHLEIDDDDLENELMTIVDFEVSELSRDLQTGLSAYACCLAKEEPLSHPQFAKQQLYGMFIKGRDSLRSKLEMRGLLSTLD
ncbi:hypothetical protein [Taylorella asinigenitalis]|uniref:Uncharacterized protein n=1 Tax=Taylorella asinigenitalis (strain MCE3) TaxID=1008459 RepID=G4QCS8_TAYAM|nr:hypothetical protein [Taylorella asinigenitalis]AEP36208.1 hypothetical protein TASI_0433 [Taylorella asinigenitalis MCE3]